MINWKDEIAFLERLKAVCDWLPDDNLNALIELHQTVLQATPQRHAQYLYYAEENSLAILRNAFKAIDVDAPDFDQARFDGLLKAFQEQEQRVRAAFELYLESRES